MIRSKQPAEAAPGHPPGRALLLRDLLHQVFGWRAEILQLREEFKHVRLALGFVPLGRLVKGANLRDLVELQVVILELLVRHLVPIRLEPRWVGLSHDMHGLIEGLLGEQLVDHRVQSTLHVLVAFGVLQKLREFLHDLVDVPGAIWQAPTALPTHHVFQEVIQVGWHAARSTRLLPLALFGHLLEIFEHLVDSGHERVAGLASCGGLRPTPGHPEPTKHLLHHLLHLLYVLRERLVIFVLLVQGRHWL